MNRFTQKAQNALNNALSCASEMGHGYVGTEHILLGLLSEEDGAASKLLRGAGADPASVRKAVEDSAGTGEITNVSAADMTPRTKNS